MKSLKYFNPFKMATIKSFIRKLTWFHTCRRCIFINFCLFNLFCLSNVFMLVPAILGSSFSYESVIIFFYHNYCSTKANFNCWLINLFEIYVLIIDNSRHYILICIYGEVYPFNVLTYGFSSLLLSFMSNYPLPRTMISIRLSPNCDNYDWLFIGCLY